MKHPDFNLLVTLDTLLETGSVAVAAKRLRLSQSAMSRALARLRETTGDPLLVRAGRKLVPTPRALEMRGVIGRLVSEADAVLRPVAELDPARLERTFTIRSGDGFVENFGPELIARAATEAPGACLRFLPRPDRESSFLREGEVDLETGPAERQPGPEVIARLLFRDRFVGVVGTDHELSSGKVTPERYAAARHILIDRSGSSQGPVDRALARLGLERRAGAIVGGFLGALALARRSTLVATVAERHTRRLREGMHSFPLPFEVSEIAVSLMWHPRNEADPAHIWLRRLVLDTCTAKRSGSP